MPTIYEKLRKIQQEAKAPKGRWNSFANYSYRSCEDLLNSVKPLLAEHNTVLLLTDELVNIGDRYYVKATATLADGDNGESVSVSAYARESATHKSFSDPQITCSSSSYARKHCIIGLLCLGNNEESQATDTSSSDYYNSEANSPFETVSETTTLPTAKYSSVSSASTSSTASASNVCETCGATVYNEKVRNFSKKKFGKVLCYNCQQDMNKVKVG